VVFLHGVLGSSQDFVDLLPRVGASGQRAIAFDLPGFGRAAPAWDFPAGFAGYTRWFGKALRKLGVPRRFLRRVYDDLDRETRCAVLRFFRSAASTAIDPSVATGQAARLRRTFGARLPVLVVWGSKAVFLRVPMARRQREAFPAARVRLLRHSGHWPFADDARSVRRLVLPFLRRAQAP
jgi:pimeloyl-ACP methyl ester carboxylesterase